MVAEVEELLDELVFAVVGVGGPFEIVAAEVVVVTVIGEEVPADDEDGVADSDGGFLLADAAGETPVLGR